MSISTRATRQIAAWAAGAALAARMPVSNPLRTTVPGV